MATEDIATAASAADSMNHIILDAVVATGVGNDKIISTADTRELNDDIFAKHHDEWVPHRLKNEDGNLNRSFRKVALWLSLLLLDELESDSL